MKPTISRVLTGIAALLVACALAYEHDWPVWGSKGTFGSGCRKIVRVPSAAAPQAQDHIHLVFSQTGGPTLYSFSPDGGVIGTMGALRLAVPGRLRHRPLGLCADD